VTERPQRYRRTLTRPDADTALAVALGESRRTAEVESHTQTTANLAAEVMGGGVVLPNPESTRGPVDKEGRSNHHAIRRALQTTLSSMASSPSEIRRRQRMAATLAGRQPEGMPHMWTAFCSVCGQHFEQLDGAHQLAAHAGVHVVHDRVNRLRREELPNTITKLRGGGSSAAAVAVLRAELETARRLSRLLPDLTLQRALIQSEVKLRSHDRPKPVAARQEDTNVVHATTKLNTPRAAAVHATAALNAPRANAAAATLNAPRDALPSLNPHPTGVASTAARSTAASVAPAALAHILPDGRMPARPVAQATASTYTAASLFASHHLFAPTAPRPEAGLPQASDTRRLSCLRSRCSPSPSLSPSTLSLPRPPCCSHSPALLPRSGEAATSREHPSQRAHANVRCPVDICTASNCVRIVCAASNCLSIVCFVFPRSPPRHLVWCRRLRPSVPPCLSASARCSPHLRKRPQ